MYFILTKFKIRPCTVINDPDWQLKNCPLNPRLWWISKKEKFCRCSWCMFTMMFMYEHKSPTCWHCTYVSDPSPYPGPAACHHHHHHPILQSQTATEVDDPDHLLYRRQSPNTSGHPATYWNCFFSITLIVWHEPKRVLLCFIYIHTWLISLWNLIIGARTSGKTLDKQL